MCVLRNPRKHLCFSVSPCSGFKPQVSLNISPPQQLGWGGAVLRPCPLSPEKCPLKNPKPPPKMMPCFKSNRGYFSARAQFTAAACRPDIVARVEGFLELTREQGSFRMGLSPTRLGHHGCHGLGLPRAPSPARGECFKGHPGIKSQYTLQTLFLIACHFLPDCLHPCPLDSKLTCGSPCCREAPSKVCFSFCRNPRCLGEWQSSSLGPLVVGWVVTSWRGGSSSQDRKERLDGDIRGLSEGIWQAWCRGKKARGGSWSPGVWLPGSLASGNWKINVKYILISNI